MTLQAYEREGDANPRIPFSLAIFAAAEGNLDEALELLECALWHDRLYVVRAEKERAFRVFRDRRPDAYSASFTALLDRYRGAPPSLGARSGQYDPSTYNE